MIRILGCLALLVLVDTFENGSRVQSAAWQYSVRQGHKFSQTVEDWLRHLRP
jgi:hypothetical protein